MRKLAAFLIPLAVVAIAPAAGKEKKSEKRDAPAAFKELVACRQIADSAARLACYDRQVASLEQAQSAGEVVVADRQQVEQAQKGLFGYSIPNLLVDHAMRNPHVPAGFWRGVNLNHNAIYVECFMDELAHAAGVDPLEFRLRLMKNHPKHRAVLEAAAKGIGWGTKPADGIFRGLCQTMGFGSYVAAGAEVSVDKNGNVKIHRIVAATNPGHVVNPDQVRAQMVEWITRLRAASTIVPTGPISPAPGGG